MKIKLKHAKESSTHPAHNEVKTTVTSIFEIAKGTQIALTSASYWVKTAGCGRTKTLTHAVALCRVRSRAMTITLILSTGIN